MDASRPEVDRVEAAETVEVQPSVAELVARASNGEGRWFRWGIAVAIAVHAVVFLTEWPSVTRTASAASEDEVRIYPVRLIRLQPPPPPEQRPALRRPVQRVAIPDPTPNEPEPIREQPVETIEIPIDDELVLGVPDEPPPLESIGPTVYTVGGEVTRPVRISGAMPVYTEAARHNRIQGVVIVECVIGADGRPQDVTVLKPLPLGLSESAVEAVSSWRFHPATLRGVPVTVRYSLTVRFTLH